MVRRNVNVKTWFDQPMKKKRRTLKRKAKAEQKLPRPVDLLRSMVHCSTIRYNYKVRADRGFSLDELKAAGINKKFARTTGIAVDKRKLNKSVETVQINVQHLKDYQSKLIVFSGNKKKQKKEMEQPVKTTTVGINKPAVKQPKLKAKTLTKEEKEFAAYEHLRKARADPKYAAIRLKRKTMKPENIEPPLKKVRLLPKED